MFGAPKQPLIAGQPRGSGRGGISSALSTKLGLANRTTEEEGEEKTQPKKTTAVSAPDEPQDLSLSAALAEASRSGSSFTPPKKAFIMRDAAIKGEG